MWCICWDVTWLTLTSHAVWPHPDNTDRIGHFRYINILTWLRGFQVKLLYLVLFSLCLSLFWELRDKRNFKNLQFYPKASEPCLNILIYRTWPIYCVQLCFVCKGERQRLLKRKLAEYEEQLKKGSESYENLKREVEEQLQTQQQLQDNMLAGLIVGFVILVMICMLPRTLLASGWSACWDFLCF